MELKTTRYYLFQILIAVTLLFAGYYLGLITAQKSVVKDLDSIQLSLNFDQLQDIKQMQFYLDNECISAARLYLEYSNDLRSKVISNLLDRDIRNSTITYISGRDAAILESLRGYQRRFLGPWAIPNCIN